MLCHLPSELTDETAIVAIDTCCVCDSFVEPLCRISKRAKFVVYACLVNVLCAVEHMFEVIVENVSGLKLLDNMIWGEADCFIQYHFPAQMASAGRVGGATIVCGMFFLSLLQIVMVGNNLIKLVL